MKLTDSLKNLTTNRIQRISELTRKIINLAGALVGIKKKDNKYDFHRLTSTAWIFLVGIPLGFVFLGNAFYLPVWALIVLIMTTLCNLDYVIDLLKDKKCFSGFSYT